MRKQTYFASYPLEGWPAVREIERYFLTPEGRRWLFDTGHDGASFDLDGIDGTDHLPHLDQRRSNISLTLTAHPTLGMALQWSKWDGKQSKRKTYDSNGDLTRLGQFVWDLHGSLNPVAFFIPYEAAWKAVKEFLETNGALPQCIEWVADDDLPPGTFAEPIAPREDWKKVTCFAGVIAQGWPRMQDIERHLVAPPAERWSYDEGAEDGYFEVHGVHGTEHLHSGEGRIDVRLTVWGHATMGLVFNWAKSGGSHDQLYASKGDITRLGERLRNKRDAHLPIGLFVPYEAAWKALNEFFETDGALPKSIEWIAERDLPPDLQRRQTRAARD